MIDDIAFLHGAGVRVILVHGGGSEINAMLGRVGIEPRFVDGLRYTDPGYDGNHADGALRQDQQTARRAAFRQGEPKPWA